MIETLGTYSEILRPPREVEEWLMREDTPWRVTTNALTGDLTAVLAGSATALGRVQIQKPRNDDTAAAYAVMAEGNALTLLHGHAAKPLTLRPQDVPAAVDAYIAALAQDVPLLPAEPSVHRVSRVDASCTWRHSDTDASRALSQARAALSAQRSGRKVLSTHGIETVTLRVTKRHTDRVYDKSAETIAAARKTRTPPPDLGPGRLVRLERQLRSRTARTHYGDNLAALADTGALMARTAVIQAADSFAAQVTTDTAADVARDLIERGATPAEAIRLLGAALLIADGGVPALTSLGMSESRAYALRARIRDLRGQPLSPEDDVALNEPDLFSPDDAEFAGDE